MQIKILGGFMAGVLLAGCSHLYPKQGVIKSSEDNQYLQAHAEQALRMPSDLKELTSEQYYPIPKINAPHQSNTVSIEPPGSQAAKRMHELRQQQRGFWGRVKDWFS